MIISGNHEITYNYESSISLGFHELRLVPKSNSFQKLLQFAWSIDPYPKGVSFFFMCKWFFIRGTLPSNLTAHC
jgi:hypothetical protein